MREVKVIFIAMEAAMLFGVILIAIFADWQVEQAWMYKLLIILCAVNAVVFQREQQAIDWDEED